MEPESRGKTQLSEAPGLSLAVQYAVQADELPRWRLRRWAKQAVAGVARARAGAGLQSFCTVTLTIRLVDADEGRQLNRDFRGKDYATNVLTFEYGTDPDGNASGDIVLCLPILLREAAEQHKTLLAHAAHLTVHGVLHALGYDHIEPDEAQHMESLEIAVLHKMGLANPYLT
ncbi:rRNA maturation RNase YbeY [Allopusillimonas ginsengisoli]|nr:rRNA maturation RNase YbeY [Allopusillimonas ginsengisoli]